MNCRDTLGENKTISLPQSIKSLDEAKEILSAHPGLDAERIYEELRRHQSGDSEKLDLSELDSVSGGADRDWVKDGCAPTRERDS